jgi:hypothetical protein
MIKKYEYPIKGKCSKHGKVTVSIGMIDFKISKTILEQKAQGSRCNCIDIDKNDICNKLHIIEKYFERSIDADFKIIETELK